MCDLLKLTNNFQSLTSCEIVSVMSCFITLTIPEKNKSYNPEGISKNLESILKEIDGLYNKYYDDELRYDLDTGSEWDIIMI